MSERLKFVVKSVQCPTCGAGEEHPRHKDMCLVRGYKVCDDKGHWWSQCLVCAGYYDRTTLEVNLPRVKDEDGRDVPVAFDPNKGWF